MKKILCSLLIVAIIFNFIIYSVSYAEPDGTVGGVSDSWIGDGTENTSATPTNGAAASILEEGKVAQKNGQEANVTTNSNASGVSMIGVILGYLALIIDIIPLQMQILLSTVATTNVYGPDGTEQSGFMITIEKIVFNQIALFNINYFNTEDTYNVGNGSEQLVVETSGANKAIKESITEMFMICRIIAMVIGLLVLIYIGIRMAIASVASDRAKYKSMLISWVQSIALMFLMVYIMVLIVNLGEALVNIFYDIRCSLLAGDKGFEVEITDTITKNIFQTSGLKLATYSLIYWIVVYSQFKFFYLYIKRVLMVGFLIMISPLITITYSIDKAGDGKAQAFGNWFSEFLMNVLIQPLHALIYMIFIFSANEIAKFAPLVAVMFMVSLGSAERMVKVIFNMRGLASLRGLNKFRKKQ